MQETIYVGLDLGSSVCQQTVMSGDGERRFSRSFATSEKSLRTAFDQLEGDVRVHMEAGELANWVQSILESLVAEVVVSHPRSLAWIGKDAVKDDKIDAGKLAELLRLGRVHEVYCAEDAKRRTFKHLVTHHEQPLRRREQARQKSKIKARLRTLGVIRKDARLFSASGQTALLESIAEPEIRQMIAQSFAVLNRMLESEREAKDSKLATARKFPEVRQLQTAPGVGARPCLPVCRIFADAAKVLEQTQAVAILPSWDHAARIERQAAVASSAR